MRKSEQPWDGRVTTEMIQEFAAANDINLIAFHGNRKVVHQTGAGAQWLTYFLLGRPRVCCKEFTAIRADAVAHRSEE